VVPPLVEAEAGDRAVFARLWSTRFLAYETRVSGQQAAIGK